MLDGGSTVATPSKFLACKCVDELSNSHPFSSSQIIDRFRFDMSSPEEEKSKRYVSAPPAAHTSADAEGQRAGGDLGVPGILRRWRREDLFRRGSLALRGLALLFSLLAFIIMASNKHGDWKDFDRYEEYRFLLGISVLSSLYTGIQSLRHVHELSTGKQMFERRISAMIDFAGDQIMAYLLVSAGSAAIPLTNRMREGADNIFTDSSATAISMTFFTFFALGLSAIIAGYKLSTQTYI